MESKLEIKITKVDGSVVTQEITCPTEAVDAYINQLFIQYAQVGVVKKGGATATLIPASQIAQVECTVPSLVIATPEDTKKVAGATKSLNKIVSIS